MSDMGVLMAGAAVKGASSALAKSYFEEYVVPLLRGAASKKTEAQLKKSFNRYVRYLESRTRVLPSLASMGGALPFEDIYEPLTITSDVKDFRHTVDTYPRELFDQARCIALTDDAGMGKSTLAKFIARSAISESQLMPIFIELRRLRDGIGIFETLCNELLGPEAASENRRELERVFEGGGFIFMLDGFDEVEESMRPALVAEINHLAAKFEFCYFLLTSRPEYAVSIFPQFVTLKILKLNKTQAHSLIRRLDGSRGLSKTLIQKVASAEVGDFMGSPLMVTLLYRAFDHRNSVPPKRTMFFRQVYDALFEDHDLSKGDAYARRKESGMDKEDFHRFVRAFGFETFKAGRISYKEEELNRHLKSSLERADINASVSKVRSDLVKAVPLLVRDGIEFRWCHKSFQDYFVSQYILYDMDGLRDELIVKMFESEEGLRYREVFRFFGEADISLLRKICVYPFLQEFDGKVDDDDDLPYACLGGSIDIFYMGDLASEEGEVEFAKCIRDRFGVSVENRAATGFVNWKDGWAVFSALKDKGARYILLGSIDPKAFPPYEGRSRSRIMASWNKAFGENNVHIDGSVSQVKKVVNELGSMPRFEAAAALRIIPKSSLVDLRRSVQRRGEALSRSALEGF